MKKQKQKIKVIRYDCGYLDHVVTDGFCGVVRSLFGKLVTFKAYSDLFNKFTFEQEEREHAIEKAVGWMRKYEASQKENGELTSLLSLARSALIDEQRANMVRAASNTSLKTLKSGLPEYHYVVPMQPTVAMIKAGINELEETVQQDDEDRVVFLYQAMLQSFRGVTTDE